MIPAASPACSQAKIHKYCSEQGAKISRTHKRWLSPSRCATCGISVAYPLSLVPLILHSLLHIGSASAGQMENSTVVAHFVA